MYHRAGIAAAAVINFSMYPPRESALPTDFIPGYSQQEREMTDEELAEQLDAFLLPRSMVQKPN